MDLFKITPDPVYFGDFYWPYHSLIDGYTMVQVIEGTPKYKGFGIDIRLTIGAVENSSLPTIKCVDLNNIEIEISVILYTRRLEFICTELDNMERFAFDNYKQYFNDSTPIARKWKLFHNILKVYMEGKIDIESFGDILRKNN